MSYSVHVLWSYIATERLPVCHLYGEGRKRIGCIMCPMASSKERRKDELRWPKYAEAYKRSIFRAIEDRKKLGRHKPGELEGEDFYNRWMDGVNEEEDDYPWLFE